MRFFLSLYWWYFELDSKGRRTWGKVGTISSAWESRELLRGVMRKNNDIFALEGVCVDQEGLRLDAEILAGHVTISQAIQEMKEYVMQHKTIDGFMNSRNW